MALSPLLLAAAALSLGALSGQVPQLHPHPNRPAGAKLTPIVAKTARRTTTAYRHRRPLEAAFAR